jgi:heme exporter protein D
MMNLGPHAAFIVAAYSVTAVVVTALIGWIVSDYAAQRRILEDLDARGVRRRSRPAHENAP